MQFKCSLDACAWFDILSIYNVKIKECSGIKKEKSIDNFTKLGREIIDQIGKLKYDEILNSDEYHDLYQANLETFNKVELAQKDNGLAKEVDSCNYQRFIRKTELQNKFFDNEINEVKVGYGE